MDLDLQARRLAAKAQTLASPKVDKVDLATMLLDAGFDHGQAVLMHAIAASESAYRSGAKNVDQHSGSEDYGLYQINQIHKPDMNRVYDPVYSVQMAKHIFDRQGYKAWMGYNNRNKDEGHKQSWESFMKTAKDSVEAALARDLLTNVTKTPPESQVVDKPMS